MMEHDKELPSLQNLQEKIDDIKGKESKPRETGPRNDMSQAMRLSIDLAAGVAVGVIGGYLLDRWFGTLPLCMIIGLFLGMAAGVRNMIRAGEAMDKKMLEDEKNEK